MTHGAIDAATTDRFFGCGEGCHQYGSWDGIKHRCSTCGHLLTTRLTPEESLVRPSHGDTGLYWKLTPSEIKARVATLRVNRETMKTYLRLKLDEEDFHGVQDAASDIRDIDSEILGLEWAIGDRKA